jgi:hypothetical protein
LLRATGIPETRLALHADPHASEQQSATPAAPGGESWLPALLDTLFLPEADFAAHREALRRGGIVLSAQVADVDAKAVAHAMEAAGAVDFDAEEAAWRRAGWSPETMAGTAAQQPGAQDPAGAAPGPQRLARRDPAPGRARAFILDAPGSQQLDRSGPDPDTA